MVISSLDSFPSRFTKKTGRNEAVAQLLANHQIGLKLNADFVYDPETRKGERTSTRFAWEDVPLTDDPMASALASAPSLATPATTPSGPTHKIQNFAILSPSGRWGHKMFIHGKELLSEAQAKAVFTDHAPPEGLTFSKAMMDKAAYAFRPESLKGRLEDYGALGVDSFVDTNKASLELAKAHYKHIDFSHLPPIREDNLLEFVTAFSSLLENNGVRLSEELQRKHKTGRNVFVDEIEVKMKREVPQKIDAYLQAHADVAVKYGQALKAYAAAHGQDWEILENFKAGVASGKTTLEDILEAGIQARAKAELVQAVGQMANPYGEPFTTAEHGMARQVVDSLQPRTMDILLAEKTPLVFFNDFSLSQAEAILSVPHSHARGKYAPTYPETSGFSEFLLVANQRLAHEEDFGVHLRHEVEHMLDMKAPKYFAERYKDQLPTLIRKDCETLDAWDDFLSTFQKDSPKEDIEKLMALVKRRGVIINPDQIEEARDVLIMEIGQIKERVKIFAEQFRGGQAPKAYQQVSNQYLEIPPIMEELKGHFGKTFMEKLMPELSRVTHEHRNDIYAQVERRRG